MVLDSLKGNKDLGLTVIFLLILASFALLDIGFASSIENSSIMTIFIKNTPPVINMSNVTPNPANPGQTLTVRANVTDVNGDTITSVNVTYYNTTHVNRTGEIPMSLDAGGYLYVNNTYTLPIDADAGTWYANITFSDGFSTIVNKTTFTVNSQLGTRLQNTPIDFGNQSVGQTAVNASSGTFVENEYTEFVRGYPLIINNTGNTVNNYTLNGSDLYGKGGSQILGKGNVTWNITDESGEGTRTGKFMLNASHWDVNTTIGSGKVQRVFFWIDIPNGLTQESFNGTVVIISADP